MGPKEARLLRSLVIVCELSLPIDQTAQAAIPQSLLKLLLCVRLMRVTMAPLLSDFIIDFLPLHFDPSMSMHRLSHPVGEFGCEGEPLMTTVH